MHLPQGETVKWRWIVPALLGFVALELLGGVMAYSTPTWNFHHTEVLRGWACVRFICLIVLPTATVVGGTFIALMLLALRWATRGRR
jgi:hypothetical protein